ncbi:hypothetical protein PPACK8108_LOCUS9886, partial [Phakopsora pachyrhizi]
MYNLNFEPQRRTGEGGTGSTKDKNHAVKLGDWRSQRKLPPANEVCKRSTKRAMRDVNMRDRVCKILCYCCASKPSMIHRHTAGSEEVVPATVETDELVDRLVSANAFMLRFEFYDLPLPGFEDSAHRLFFLNPRTFNKPNLALLEVSMNEREEVNVQNRVHHLVPFRRKTPTHNIS